MEQGWHTTLLHGSGLQSFCHPRERNRWALQFGSAEVVNNLSANLASPVVFYDVSPDGKKILLDRVSQQVSQSVSVLTDLTAELKK